MTQTTLHAHEFIIRFKNPDMVDLLVNKEVKLELVNPHKLNEFDALNYQLLKLLINALAVDIKPFMDVHQEMEEKLEAQASEIAELKKQLQDLLPF